MINDRPTGTLVDSVLELIREGHTLAAVARLLGFRRAELLEMVLDNPFGAERLKKAQDECWDAMAESLWDTLHAIGIPTMEKRARLEGGLKMLARWCPQRYGEATLLKRNPEEVSTELGADQVLAELMDFIERPIPLRITKQ